MWDQRYDTLVFVCRIAVFLSNTDRHNAEVTEMWCSIIGAEVYTGKVSLDVNLFFFSYRKITILTQNCVSSIWVCFVIVFHGGGVLFILCLFLQRLCTVHHCNMYFTLYYVNSHTCSIAYIGLPKGIIADRYFQRTSSIGQIRNRNRNICKEWKI